MTDVFHTGSFFHPQDLWTQLDTLIQSAGWTVRATPTAGSDRVFHSDGEDGYQDNYLKIAHKLQDPMRASRGFAQRLDDDGYSDYVNFLGYQWYPLSGGATDGYGEIGMFGPRLYFIRGGAQTDIRWSNFHKGSAGDPRWTDMKSNLGVSWGDDRYASNSSDGVFDGHRYIYYNKGIALYKFDISTGTTTTIDSNMNNISSVGGPLALSYIKDRDEVAIVSLFQSIVDGNTVHRFSFDRNDAAVLNEPGENPPWALSPQPDHGAAAAMGNYFYFFKGDITADFAVYNFDINKWTNLTNFPVTGFENGGDCIILTKEETGLANHRLYANPGQTKANFYSMDLNDDGSPVGAGTWDLRTSTPVTGGLGSRFFWAGADKLYWIRGTSGTQQELYEYDTVGDTWSLLDATYFWATYLDGAFVKMHHSYQSRVRAKVNEDQKFWFFGSKDRITVVVKDKDDNYYYCYAGTIDSYFDDKNIAISTADVSSGGSVLIPVDDVSGFTVTQRVQIAARGSTTTPGSPFSVTSISGTTKFYNATENTEITAIGASSITLGNLNHDYAAGAVIATDTQNFIVTCEGTRYAQSLNLVPESPYNLSGSGDLPENVYVVEPSVNTTATAFTDTNDRTEQFVVWPMAVFTEASINRFSGKEVRGQLRNAFVAGNGLGQSEDVIQIGNNSYILFKIARQEDTRFIAIGPVV